ncbi:MAG: DUF4163 domain-containing protein [Ruminococcus sp.]|nr:DUF4163 domain-containing protein [Ruminococcus sp.]MCM1380955.1 DUF4163 domain-containing protein [Muribaculaceae bacterium]MCM1479537.1 DUF4163 domain-containing protein [Muribaculaceae bacterium]
MRKNIFIAVLLSFLLTGCEKNSAEISLTETGAETVTSTKTVASTVTETSTETAEKVTETETVTEIAEEEKVKITPADEVYDVYPSRIIYPEKAVTNITAETVQISENFEKGGKTIVSFSAAYPVFSGGDEAVMKKINDSIKAYIDGIYNAGKEETERYVLPEVKEGEDDFPYDLCGFYTQSAVTGGNYYGYKNEFDVNGNILSIYLEEYSYGAGAAHGIGEPVPMMFDLRTGERVLFSDLVGDAEGMSEALSKALFDYRYAYTYTNSSYRSDDADKYAEFNEKRISEGFRDDKFIEFGEDGEGNYFAVYCNSDDRAVFREGCVSMYLAPYEYGSHADGIRRVDAPVGDIMPYLNEEGRALLEGYAAAESVPVNVIENKGKRYFDNVFPVLTIGEYNYQTRLTDSDYELMGFFPGVGKITLFHCADVDFEKLAKIKNIDNITELEMYYCEFGDISPLFGTNITYISGYGKNMPKEQAEKFEAQGGGRHVGTQLVNR